VGLTLLCLDLDKEREGGGLMIFVSDLCREPDGEGRGSNLLLSCYDLSRELDGKGSGKASRIFRSNLGGFCIFSPSGLG
jgi:hypothetical protein